MSDLKLPVEVDSPSDTRWERMGREMFARLDASPGPAPAGREPGHGGSGGRRRAAMVVGLVAAAAAIGLVVRAVRPPADSHRARLETAEGSSQFTVGESSLVVGPRSLVLVSGDDDHGVDVVLDRGQVTCIVAPRRGRPPFVVEAGDVQVRVVGTKFAVYREGSGASVDVEHGVVEVVARGAVATVSDGQHWSEPTGSSSVGTESEIPQPAQGSSAAPLQEPVLRSAPVAAPAFSPLGPASPTTAGPASAGMTARSTGRRDAPEPVSAPPLPAGEPSVTPQVATTPSPQQQFELAARVERTNPDQAMSLYQSLAAGGSAWSANALFAMARLEADRGRRADAARHLDEYLSRYPRGINAEDARALLQRMQ
ncbi:MAG: FecR domain-containing protein [Polyangiaceae bacterium]